MAGKYVVGQWKSLPARRKIMRGGGCDGGESERAGGEAPEGGEGPMEEPPADELEESLADAGIELEEEVTEEELVNEVTRRVAARLLKEAKK